MALLKPKEKDAKPKPHSHVHELSHLLFQLYLANNNRLEHKVFIYSYRGILGVETNPFHYVSGTLPPSVKKTLIVQNLPVGEMIQAFITPFELNGEKMFQLDNTIIYGNKNGLLTEINLAAANIEKSEKYQQFTKLVKGLLLQFQQS
ncbi:hypothetical protein QDY71_08055 [Kingella negevensis]|uniref:Uncharacterized protein n=1 Tax=Kingella negevensis TaxID=1522312 RepID=A0A238TA67_9NEIS|nr:hypothetical protein [Kingella negevensis]MDK4683666.1 hypothetical protein [Kingella negevensis]MDK4697699.1 hypothetical protein [Kingella negevensis]MDK4708439.1 hypothetical protein [Kingella negevensis]MDK4710900.1 hypothetical protein [Kingella negevensis]SNB67548.1 Uncharacterised protein [Kingella negevensis]